MFLVPWTSLSRAIGVLSDLPKAFDTVDHAILLNKLEKLGIKGKEINFFRSYLESRLYQCVKITKFGKCFISGWENIHKSIKKRNSAIYFLCGSLDKS